jgi:hypothetical protein
VWTVQEVFWSVPEVGTAEPSSAMAIAIIMMNNDTAHYVEIIKGIHKVEDVVHPPKPLRMICHMGLSIKVLH